MVGSSILKHLKKCGYKNILTRTSKELDLTRQAEVEEFLKIEKPDYIFLSAAKVGGILANDTFKGEFIYQNLMIEANVIHAAWQAGVRRILFLGSSCIYPRDCPQPIDENFLLSGPLEKTNEPYAIAKIAGIKLCESYNIQYGTEYVSVMPTNLYGPNDNYDLENSHVLPALIRKAHEAKIQKDDHFIVWGSGRPMREFLYVEDMADACVFMMENHQIKNGLFNIGTGKDITIRDLASIVINIVGFKGKIKFDHNKPDGTLRKLLDVKKIQNLGWSSKIPLKEGIKRAYSDFLEKSFN